MTTPEAQSLVPARGASSLSGGAREDLASASASLAVGRLEEAAAALRRYFAKRYKRHGAPLSAADEDAAALAATVLVLLGEWEEALGVARLASDAPPSPAMLWITFCRRAAEGDVEGAIASRGALVDHPLAGFEPAVLVAAAECGLGRIGAKEARALEGTLGDLDPRLADRLRTALAAAALRRGERAAATEKLSALSAEAPPLSRAIAALSKEDFDAAAAAQAELGDADRQALVAVAAHVAVSSSPEAGQRVLDLVLPMADEAGRAALVAAAATALGRAGRADDAIALLAREPESSSPALAAAAAVSGVLAGRMDVADQAIARLAAGDPVAVAVRIWTLAIRRDRGRLLDEVRRTPSLPAHLQAPVAGAVLDALARLGAWPTASEAPPWLAARPDTARALYGWGLMRLAHDETAEALAALEEAVSRDAALAAQGDALDVARLLHGRRRLAEGAAAEALELVSRVESARLANAARKIDALAWWRGKEGTEADVLVMSRRLDEVAKTSAGADRERIAIVAAEAFRLRVRALLLAGDTAGARRLLDGLSDDDADLGFLRATLALVEGRDPAAVLPGLEAAIAMDPGHAAVHVLHAEVAAKASGLDKLELLEALRARHGGASGVLAEALAIAYGGASRGLDAKRTAMAEVRRLGANVPPSLADVVRAALSLEAPPKEERRESDAKVVRAPVASLLPAAKVGERAHVLVRRVEILSAQSSTFAAEVAPLVQRLKRGVVAEDWEAARAAELEILGAVANAGMQPGDRTRQRREGMTMFWAIAAVALLVALALAVRAVASMTVGRPRLPDGREALRGATGLGDASSHALGTVAGPELVLRSAAPVDARPIDPLPAPDVDLSVLGVPDDKDAADRELWRTAKARIEAKK